MSLINARTVVIPEQLLPLLRADPVLSIAFGNGEVHAHATAFAGYWYSLEASGDLQNWTSLATHFAEADAFEFAGGSQAATGNSFYRVRLVPGP